MIETKDLTKDYGPTRAVNRVSFTVQPGEVVGFLGPNGAGKSTTIRILTGYMPPSAGSASLAGHDVVTDSRAARRQLGYLPEGTPLYPEMRVTEYLDYRGRLLKMPRKKRKARINEVLDLCNVAVYRRRTIGRLSKGNRQRVGLAQALLHEPPVLIMDEPTSGFDPNQVIEFRKLLDRLRGKHTILLSTHILPEVEKVADRLLLIAAGRLLLDGTPMELARKVGGGGATIDLKAPEGLVQRVLGGIEGVQAVQTREDQGWTHATVTSQQDTDLTQALGTAAAERGWVVRELKRQGLSMEAVFSRITADPQALDSAPAAAQEVA